MPSLAGNVQLDEHLVIPRGFQLPGHLVLELNPSLVATVVPRTEEVLLLHEVLIEVEPEERQVFVDIWGYLHVESSVGFVVLVTQEGYFFYS